MNPFGFLDNVRRGVEQYFQPGMAETKSTLEQYFPSKTFNLRLDKSPNAPILNMPKPAPQVAQQAEAMPQPAPQGNMAQMVAPEPQQMPDEDIQQLLAQLGILQILFPGLQL